MGEFHDIFWILGRLWSKFWISLYMYVLYILISPSYQYGEKSAGIKRETFFSEWWGGGGGSEFRPLSILQTLY